jgi:hypothetical protein
VVHDLVLFPLYAGADRVLTAVLPGPKVNYLRVPALGAGLALLMFWPGIVRQGEVTHLAAHGPGPGALPGARGWCCARCCSARPRWSSAPASGCAGCGRDHRNRVVPFAGGRDPPVAAIVAG